jgi:hypothetical protein
MTLTRLVGSSDGWHLVTLLIVFWSGIVEIRAFPLLGEEGFLGDREGRTPNNAEQGTQRNSFRVSLLVLASRCRKSRTHSLEKQLAFCFSTNSVFLCCWNCRISIARSVPTLVLSTRRELINNSLHPYDERRLFWAKKERFRNFGGHFVFNGRPYLSLLVSCFVHREHRECMPTITTMPYAGVVTIRTMFNHF